MKKIEYYRRLDTQPILIYKVIMGEGNAILYKRIDFPMGWEYSGDFSTRYQILSSRCMERILDYEVALMKL